MILDAIDVNGPEAPPRPQIAGSTILRADLGFTQVDVVEKLLMQEAKIESQGSNGPGLARHAGAAAQLRAGAELRNRLARASQSGRRRSRCTQAERGELTRDPTQNAEQGEDMFRRHRAAIPRGGSEAGECQPRCVLDHRVGGLPDRPLKGSNAFRRWRFVRWHVLLDDLPDLIGGSFATAGTSRSVM
jgi:hypothetical protein